MNRILGFILLFVNCQFSFVNNSSAQRFKAGITGGLTISDVCAYDPVDHDNDFLKVGYVAGGFVNTAAGERGTLELEINYIQKGTLQNPDSNNMNYFKLALNYVEVPIIYKYRLTQNLDKPSGFDVHGGISIGQLVHSSVEGDYVSQNPDMSFLNKTDVSLLIGLNYNFSKSLGFCLRYSNSLIPAVKRNSISPLYYLPPEGTFNNGNNMVWHFMFQYTFGGGASSSVD